MFTYIPWPLFFEYQICKYCVSFWKIFKINWSILHGFWLLIFYTKLILRELCHFILNTRASFHVWSLFTTKCMLCFCYSCLEHPFAISRSSFCHSNAHSISNFVSCSSSMQQHITHNAYINENMQYKGRKRTIVVETKRYNIPFVYVCVCAEREREREIERDFVMHV